jgi:Carboxypeptidase regulatory-like domain
MPSRFRVCTALCGFSLAFSAFLAAQTATTSLRGTVYDPKGAVISGAVVTVTNPATGFTRTTKTSAQGEYQLPELPPANYVLEVSAAGFAKLEQSGIQLLVNTPETLNPHMLVEGGTTMVEVAGSAPLVNTVDASLGHAFDTTQIADLPFEGRDPTGILSLQAGVVFTGNSDSINPASDSRSGSVNGARSDQTNITLDGVDNNDQLLGTAFSGAVRAPLDSLQEFKVTTADADADSGRSSGGQVALVTKSGTNHIHGGVYEYNRSGIGEGNDWFNKNTELLSDQPNTPLHLVRNTFGAFVGGPIIKDRFFFFADFESQRVRQNEEVTRVVPSQNLRNGIVSYPCSDDPTCPGSGVETLSASNLASMDPNCSSIGSCPLGPGPNPAVEAIFQQYPEPNTDTVGDGFNYRGFAFSSPLPSALNAYVTKLDYNLTRNGNHRLFVRGILNGDRAAQSSDTTSITGDGGSQFPHEPANLTVVNTSKALTVGYTATITSSMINDFRFGYIREALDSVGLQSQHFVQFRGMDNLTAETPTKNTAVPVKNWVDDFTKVKGTHTFQVGMNYRLIDDIRASNETSYFSGLINSFWLAGSCISLCPSPTSLQPSAFPNPATPGQNFPAVNQSFETNYDFPVAALVGLVTQIGSNYNLTKTLTPLAEGAAVPRHFRGNEWEWYGQDTWRLKPNFTVTYGLRYTLLPSPYETNGQEVAPTSSLGNWFQQRAAGMLRGQTYDPLISFALAGNANGGKPLWNTDLANLAPRLAFAYSPNGDSGLSRKLWGGPGKSSIRVGYGLYYDHFGEGIVNSFDELGAFGLTTSITNPAGIQTVDASARFSALNSIPTVSYSTTASCPVGPCAVQEPPPSGSFPVTPPTSITGGGFAITWGLNDKLRTPYSHVLDFSLTRELSRNFTFEGAYVGRFAHRLLQEEDIAMPLNLYDPSTGTSYFQAATALAKLYRAGTPIQNITPSAVGTKYWEDMFPGAAGPSSTNIGAEVNNPGVACLGTAPTNVTATQAMYDLFCENNGNETTALEYADVPELITNTCYPACTVGNGGGGYAYYNPQYSSLYGWFSDGNSAYNAGEFSLRHRETHGLVFDFNYTYSKSIDQGSNAERINQFQGGGFASQVINSWFPKQLRAPSDFDTTHAINANWVYELPFGRGKALVGDAGGLLNGVIGGWRFSGLSRWSSGYPFTVAEGFGWATNFELESAAILDGTKPKTGSFIVPEANGGTGPNAFKDPGIADPTNPNAAPAQFRASFPGESGERNELRGPGTFNLDVALSKSWNITESQAIKFTWENFNLTNSPRFDVGTMQLSGNNSISNSTNFGNFLSTLSNPRVMEFALRYTF